MNIFSTFVGQFKNTSNSALLKQTGNTSGTKISSEIDKSRFEEVLLRRGVPSNLIEKLFNTIDVNGDGKVNKNDFQRVLQTNAQTIRTSDIPETTNSTRVKTNETTISNIPPIQKKTYPAHTQKPNTIEDRVGTIAKHATTYNKNGVPHISAISAFINKTV